MSMVALMDLLEHVTTRVKRRCILLGYCSTGRQWFAGNTLRLQGPCYERHN